MYLYRHDDIYHAKIPMNTQFTFVYIRNSYMGRDTGIAVVNAFNYYYYYTSK